MCGLCGIVDFARPVDAGSVLAMRQSLVHRGPDGSGLWQEDRAVLGHTRLAIIDLSDRGLQPLSSDDGSLHLLHNGEIYNYRELRAELEDAGHSFDSNSDTEVSKRSTRGMPALAKAETAISEAPWVTLRPDPSDSSLPV